MAWGLPSNFTSGQTAGVSTALNQILSSLHALGDHQGAYTPTWTASTSGTPAVGTGGSLTGASIQAGQFVVFRVQLLLGTGFVTGTGGWLFGLPVAAQSPWSSTHFPLGPASYNNAATDTVGVAISNGASACQMNVGSARVGSATATWAAGDTLGVLGFYEAA